MADWEDYYEILGVSPDSSHEEIKDAYRYKVNILHPDRLMGAPESVRRRAGEDLKKVNRAYEVLRDPQKRQEYHSEWVKQSAEPKETFITRPEPAADPPHIRFSGVEPGEIKKASFIIRNLGGPYSKIWFSNPDSWVRVVHWASLTDFDELPLEVEIEAEGEDWGKSYLEYIRVKLDEEETQVRIELQTKPEPVRERVRVSGVPTPRPARPPPPPVSARRGFPAWGKWFIGLALLGLMGVLIGQFWPSDTRTSSPPAVRPLLPRTIVFVSNRDGNVEIYATALDGTNQANLSNNSANDWSPTWAPDGQEICFVSDRNGGIPGIYLLDADGSNVRQLAVDGQDPCWFRDGKKIAFTRRTGKYYALFVMNTDGTGQEQIPVDPSTIIKSMSHTYGRHLRRPCISPDGTRLAFAVGDWESAHSYDVYVANLDGTNLKRFSGGDNPSWSPDGQKIAFREDPGFSREPYGQVGYPYVKSFDASGDDTRLATIYCGGGLDWALDESMIVFSGTIDFFYVAMNIYVVETDTGILKQITKGNVDNWDPDWRHQ